jgi:Transposase DDE domain
MAKISAIELLDLLPCLSLDDLSKATGVDYKVHKLTGSRIFNLLLYGLLSNDRTSLRTLEDDFNSPKFKFFFNVPSNVNTKFNSLSDRFSTLSVDYFEQIYHKTYQLFSKYYPPKKALPYHIHRLDSTMVAEQARKLHQGMSVGRKKNGKKQAKYTLSLTDIFPSSVEVFTAQSALSEDITMPITIYEAIGKCIDKTKDNVWVFDRGLTSYTKKEQLHKEGIFFVTRIKDKCIYQIESSRPISVLQVNNLTIISDETIILNKTSTPFRLIKAINDEGKNLSFLTNRFNIPLADIINIYRQRWEIETFFRFLKQELNLSHLMAMNENGITIILYMTLILSMLILVYKQINELGFKTAKRHFKMELDTYITALIIEDCGGDSAKWVT